LSAALLHLKHRRKLLTLMALSSSLRAPVNSSVAAESIEYVGTSAAAADLRDEIKCAARSHGKVLISGESGSGKEVAARLIHALSPRRGHSLVTLNCAGLPETLLESELFGHTRGSFTGAYRDKPGLLELGHRGTVFLDEIGEMSLRMQSTLLRFLETGEIQRVGSTRAEARVDVRIIAATNRNLPALIAEKTFRQDLYYRLNVLHIAVPPLRDRREDIPALIEYMANRLARQYGITAPVTTPAAMRRLLEHDWPGNVRELRNVLERTIARRGSGEIGLRDLPPEFRAAPPAPVAAAPPPPDRVDALFRQMVDQRETFWTAVYQPFISRDLTRDTLQAIVSRGLEQTRGNYRMLVELFNMPSDDYKRFLNFLRKHQSHVPFQPFRGALAKVDHARIDRPVPPVDTSAPTA
jgi:transcriptional regulator with PAS, ATPase and Fis domain